MKISVNKNIFIKIALGVIVLCLVVSISIAFLSDIKKNNDDKKRKADIAQIAGAIMDYNKNGALPASSGGWCDLKQDGTGCPGFPGLISEYLGVIPRDPDFKYYKYFSDSKNFVLRADMADEASVYVYTSSYNNYSLQKKNFLTINQSNGSENGTLNGFESYNEAKLTSDETVFYEGVKAVRVDSYTNNSGVFIGSPIHSIPAKKAISIQAVIWIPLGKSISFGIRGDDGKGMYEYASKKVDGNNSWQRVELNYRLTENWKKIGIVVHSANYNMDPNFYYFVDSLKLEYGNKASEWGMGS